MAKKKVVKKDRSQYQGITFPKRYEKVVHNKELSKKWKKNKCTNGFHLLDEVWSIEDHYLVCDVCGLVVNIASIDFPANKS